MPLPLNSDRATLFYDAAASRAVLVVSHRGRQRRHHRKFADAVTALRWCLDTRTHFVLFWPSAAQEN
jgi:hypothetical protein